VREWLGPRVTEAAAAIGAVNTLWLENGVLHGDNTDAEGFIANLDAEAFGWETNAHIAAVLGAGGAARAILHALLTRGVERIVLINRSRARAEALAQAFGPRVIVADWEARDRALAGAGLLVNTTSLGMVGQPELDITLDALHPDSTVADIVYAPLETPLLAAARATERRPVDGLGMLLHQAAPGFARWFGVRPSVTPALRTLIVADIEGNGKGPA
jgi:shikimate dehydrogenase